jgi:hypothetical protein
LHCLNKNGGLETSWGLQIQVKDESTPDESYGDDPTYRFPK